MTILAACPFTSLPFFSVTVLEASFVIGPSFSQIGEGRLFFAEKIEKDIRHLPCMSAGRVPELGPSVKDYRRV
ncbi:MULTISPECIES: hypothetical protein [unclassified Rathayibacter]|uniref:hypothetical protein n=1 Tax=unclassified Rathayibacter TaxID=2609250 RepID=UPI0011CDA1C1|nr:MULTISPECIES: hypothetical protein [unclassified Rathayibacter]